MSDREQRTICLFVLICFFFFIWLVFALDFGAACRLRRYSSCLLNCHYNDRPHSFENWMKWFRGSFIGWRETRFKPNVMRNFPSRKSSRKMVVRNCKSVIGKTNNNKQRPHSHNMRGTYIVILFPRSHSAERSVKIEESVGTREKKRHIGRTLPTRSKISLPASHSIFLCHAEAHKYMCVLFLFSIQPCRLWMHVMWASLHRIFGYASPHFVHVCCEATHVCPLVRRAAREPNRNIVIFNLSVWHGADFQATAATFTRMCAYILWAILRVYLCHTNTTTMTRHSNDVEAWRACVAASVLSIILLFGEIREHFRLFLELF